MIGRIAALAGLGLAVSIGAIAPAAAQGTVPCAREGGYCSVPYPTTVIYGFRGATTSREVGPGGIPCNNQVFGDPAPGAGKRCSYIVRERGRYRDGDRYERRRRDNY